jgi:hypothetical protein
VRPEIRHVVEEPEEVVHDREDPPASVATAVYERIAVPPVVAASQDTVISRFPLVPATCAGEPGSPTGVADFVEDAPLVTDVPPTVAVTVTVNA